MDYLLSLLPEHGQYQSLAQAGAALLAPVIVIAAIIFVIASWRQASVSRRIDKQQAEVRADIGKLRTVIAEAISGKWTAMEEKLGGAINAAADKQQQQQQQQAAIIAETLQQQNALLESIAATLNENVQAINNNRQQDIDATARAVSAMGESINQSLAKAEQQQQQAAADIKKATEGYGVFIHDQSALMAAAQERLLASAAEQLRQSAATLTQTEQNTAGFAERTSADINNRLDGIDKRVHSAIATFENLDNKLALLREVQEQIQQAGKDIGALSQILTLAAAAVSTKNHPKESSITKTDDTTTNTTTT